MMYIIVLVTLALLVVYLLWIWLSRELGDAVRAGRTAARVRRGGRTPELLVEETQAAFRNQGLEADLVVVSHDALELYDRLRERVIDRRDRPDLPAATVLALAGDADAARLYVRAVDTPPDEPGRETTAFHDFEAVTAIETVAHEGPEGLVAPGEQAIALHIDGTAYHLAVEPAWHIAADDLARQLKALIHDHQPPPGAPAIVR